VKEAEPIKLTTGEPQDVVVEPVSAPTAEPAKLPQPSDVLVLQPLRRDDTE